MRIDIDLTDESRGRKALEAALELLSARAHLFVHDPPSEADRDLFDETATRVLQDVVDGEVSVAHLVMASAEVAACALVAMACNAADGDRELAARLLHRVALFVAAQLPASGQPSSTG